MSLLHKAPQPRALSGLLLSQVSNEFEFLLLIF